MVPKMGGGRRKRRRRWLGSVWPRNLWSGKHEFGHPFAEKDKEPHIPNPEEANRRQGLPFEHQPMPQGKGFTKMLEAEILYPAQGYFELLTWLQHLNSRQKILLLLVKTCGFSGHCFWNQGINPAVWSQRRSFPTLGSLGFRMETLNTMGRRQLLVSWLWNGSDFAFS